MKRSTVEDIVCVILLMPLTLFLAALMGVPDGIGIKISTSIVTRLLGAEAFIAIVYLAYINYKHEK